MNCGGRKAEMNDKVEARRKSGRLPYGATIQCSKCISEGKVNTYESPLEIKVVNISSEGLCISTTEVFKKGAVLEFDIQLEDTLYKSVSATIIWSIDNENNYRYGLHIKNITGKFSIHIFKLESRLSTSI